MQKWESIFRELKTALAEARQKYKHLTSSSIIRIRVLLANKDLQHYKVSFNDVGQKIWDLAEEYTNIVYFCVETSRSLPIYQTTRYNLLQGEGASGDENIIRQFSNMPNERRDLIIRLLLSQIRDEIEVEDGS